MLYPDNDEAADNVCTPIWVHVNHLVSYCTKSAPGLDANTGSDTNDGRNGQPDVTLVCSRQYCVFRFRKQ